MLTVVTAVYGLSHVPFIGALLESLARCRTPRVILVHGGLSSALVKQITAPYPMVEPMELPPDVADAVTSADRSRRVALKTSAWLYALEHVCASTLAWRPLHLVFLDADTLVCPTPEGDSPLGIIFTREDFHVAYTTRPGRWPINSGVLFLRERAVALPWFRTWATTTDWLLADGGRAEIASGHHGSADQAALVMSLALHREIRTLALAGSTWNQTVCADPASAHVFHYKGCLPLLLWQREYGKAFGDERTPHECEPVFDLWRDHYRAFRYRAFRTESQGDS